MNNDNNWQNNNNINNNGAFVNDSKVNLALQSLIPDQSQNEDSLLTFEPNFQKFKELTTTHLSSHKTQFLPLIHNIPTIKEIINKQTVVHLSKDKENKTDTNKTHLLHHHQHLQHNNSSKLIKQEEAKSKTLFDVNKFVEIHNRNLHIIKKMTDKHSLGNNDLAIQIKKEKNETSMDRLNKIKKHFRIDFSISQEKIRIASTATPPPVVVNELYYFYHIIPGNNSETIRKCMKHRLRWREGFTMQDAHLMWSPLSKAIPYKKLDKNTPRLQAMNHFEFHKVISNKMHLFNNLMQYCESKNLDVFTYMPMTIYIQYESINYLRQFNSFSYLFTHIEDFLSKENKVKYRDYFYINQYDKLGGGKSALYIPHNHFAGKNMWLIKAINLNRGRCIKLSNTIDGIENNIKHFYQGVLRTFREIEPNNDKEGAEKKPQTQSQYCPLPQLKLVKKMNSMSSTNNQSQAKSPPKINYSIHNLHIDKSKYQSSNVILQKYIEKPLLYKGRKFDIRIWVLLTHKMEVFAFKEGHLKAASVNYDIQSSNSYIHLTNYSVQKYNDNFSKFEYGNEISFEDFQNELDKNEGKKISVRSDLFPKICDIIRLTMESAREKLNPFGRKMCFEIFGYDFIFDIDYNPYLLEINTNPGLEISSPLISYLIPRMIDDSLRLTIDELFETEYGNKAINAKYSSPFPVKGYSNEENLFQKICELNVDECKIRKK